MSVQAPYYYLFLTFHLPISTFLSTLSLLYLVSLLPETFSHFTLHPSFCHTFLFPLFFLFSSLSNSLIFLSLTFHLPIPPSSSSCPFYTLSPSIPRISPTLLSTQSLPSITPSCFLPFSLFPSLSKLLNFSFVNMPRLFPHFPLHLIPSIARLSLLP